MDEMHDLRLQSCEPSLSRMFAVATYGRRSAWSDLDLCRHCVICLHKRCEPEAAKNVYM